MCKKLIFLACFVFVLGMATTIAEAADPSLVGYWNFDEGSGTIAHDSSNNGYDGTLVGGATWAEGRFGGGIQLDGTSGYVSIPNFTLTTDTITFVAWLNGWKGGDWAPLLSSRVVNACEMNFGDNATLHYTWNGDAAATWSWTGGPTIPQDSWAMLAVTIDPDKAVAYVYTEAAGLTQTTNSIAHIVQTVGALQIGSSYSPRFIRGIIDEAAIYDRALTETEILSLVTGIGGGYPYAFKPGPADGGLHEATWVTLSWKAGDFAVSHDVYMGDNFDAVNDGTGDTFRGNQALKSTYLVAGFTGYPFPDGLVPGTTYYWRIDEVNDADPNSPWKGNVWSFTVPSKKAYQPNPADGLEYIIPDVTLSWTGGLGSVLHSVIFGESFEEVDAAAVGIPAPFPSYTPGNLEFDKTYYWRIDENDRVTTHKGDVWSFKTLPDIQISDPNLEGWWKLDEGAGLTAVDWSGHGNHGTLMGGSNWIDAYDGGGVEFDQKDGYVDTGYTTNLPIWTISAWVTSPDAPSDRTATGPVHRESNFQINWDHGDPVFRGSVALNTDAFYAASFGPLQADTWYHLAATYDGNVLIAYKNGVLISSNQAPTGAPAAESATLKLGRHAVAAQYFGGTVDDVRVYSRVLTLEEIQQTMRGDPYVAWNANPTNGEIPFVRDALPLTWSAGDNASQHDVYFGTDRDAVNDADTTTADIYRGRQAQTSYSPPEGVEWGGGPYYWRIDQVKTDATITKGRIWKFTVADYILVDDFEDYDAGDNQIWFTWHDGLGAGAPGVPGYIPGNGTGSAVGDETTASYTEESIVHGGRQSMPISYDNNKQGSAKYSETEMTLTAPRDWTQEGVTNLSLWFRGYPASVGSFVEGPTGTFTMTGSGADIWLVNGVEADEFHFAYKTLSGRGSIIAKVNSIDNTNAWAKAGVMIRETLDPGSAHATMVVTPGSGVSFQRRPGTVATSIDTTTAAITAPYWVKIERDLAGNFTAYSSANGTTWQMVGVAEPISMATNVYIGLAVTSHDAALTCQAVFSNITTTGSVGSQWMNQDIGIASNAADPVYVAVSNAAGASAVVVNDNPAAAQIDTWTEAWVIPLQAFADQGIDLTNVDRIAIGLGTRGNMTIPGGSGKLFIDDIRLTRPAPEPEPEPQP